MRDPLVVEITIKDVRWIVGAARKAARGERKRSEKRGFVPYPGKRDANLVRAEALERLAERLEQEMDRCE